MSQTTSIANGADTPSELVFTEFKGNLSDFIDKTDRDLDDPSSRAAQYMARMRGKMHQLDRICFITQARVAFVESTAYGHQNPALTDISTHKVGLVTKQPTQFGFVSVVVCGCVLVTCPHSITSCDAVCLDH